MLNFVAARYALDGTFLGLSAISGNDLQLCPGISKYMDLAFRFGSRYKLSCRLTAKELLKKAPHNEFLDLYLQHYDKSQSLLYAVPLVIANISVNAEFSNKVMPTAPCRYFRLGTKMSVKSLTFSFVFARKLYNARIKKTVT